MEIHQIAHYANDTSLKPKVRQMYWKACRELSRINQDLMLYQNAQEGYRKHLMLGNLSIEGRERLKEEYEKTCRIVWELKWRKIFLEAFTPCDFYLEPIEDIIYKQLTSSRLVQEEKRLKATRELGKTLEQLSIDKISFNEARPVIKGYLDNSQN